MDQFSCGTILRVIKAIGHKIIPNNVINTENIVVERSKFILFLSLLLIYVNLGCV